MSERFQNFCTQINLAQNDWRIMAGNPYISAYTHAYETYKETLNAQKDADKQAGELFVTAACIATGSVLLGSIGSLSLKMLARRTVVQIASRSLGTNFARLFRVVRKNEGVAFAVGNFVDSAKGGLKAKAEKIAGTYAQTVTSTITPEPLVQFLQMDSIMRANVNCAIRMAQMIEEDSSLGDKEKAAAYAPLMAAPLYNSPTQRASPSRASLAELIELSFYLSAVLETDSLITWPPSYGADEFGRSITTEKAKSVPITQRPGEAGYPAPKLPRSTYGTPYQTVGIDRAGGKVQARTNELCKKVFNKELYSSTFFGLGGPADTKKRIELKQADAFLVSLANTMKPSNPMEALR